MKKTYINPALEVVKIQTIGMLADSLVKGEATVTDESNVLGRDFDFDDED